MKRRGTTWKTLITVLAAVTGLLLPALAGAVGTPAGVRIPNAATLHYSLDGKRQQPIVAEAPQVTVAQVISVAVTWQDGAPVLANSPDLDKPLAFVVSNTGNASATFRLVRSDDIPGDQFDPQAAKAGAIWIESGARPGFQSTGPDADTVYVPAVTDLVLPADGSRAIYLVSAIPAGQPNGATGNSALAAVSTTPGAAGATPGTQVGTLNGMQIVVGAGGGQGRASGAYLVSGVNATLAKSVLAVVDPSGGNRVMTGSVLTYRLVVTFGGTGLADNVVIKDPLPDALSYVRGSLTVDGSPRTDAEDGDAASVVDRTLQVALGSVPAPATRVIEFKATVN
ncbi:MAG TPA: hypothetical protein VFM98_19270 [Ramlibacter sp.]|uniref:hypothetical protein n=1 Tax=Ramlibacter sp. TaxID=1917967 RepID=UPI002D7F851F|nr:hypothetical protein [Ramlibacter sp.]HET8747749.1 hypothetical protein [Ramlibacter sp.]